MKVSLNLLNKFVDLKKEKPKDLAQKITEHCFEVEKIISGIEPSYEFKNVFVAKVLEWQKHPNADRLRVVKLDLGDRVVEPVVCGANNFDVGDLVALALPGAFIPNDVHNPEHKGGFNLERAKIRGVESQGMICSAFELGIAQQPETKPEILLLPKTAEVGAALETQLPNKKSTGSADTIFDFALPANRPDLFSHIGIARELVGILGYKPKIELERLQKLAASKELQIAKKAKLSVHLNSKQCSFYVGMRLKVKIKPTPDEIKKPLVALGHNGVNNVVDITNYVLHEVGQPTHAFDAAKVEHSIIVRPAKNGEKVMTLDGKERALTSDMLAIADKNKVLGIAGIMGGKESGVSESTSEIILESATFDPVSIRKTSKQLGLRTDASTIYEKNLTPALALIGALRVFELLKEYADAELLEIFVSTKPSLASGKIKFKIDEINNLVGSNYSASKIKKDLAATGIKISGTSSLTADIPYFRSDIEDYAGIAEELLKIQGINEIPKKSLVVERMNSTDQLEQNFWQIKQNLVVLGYNEVQNYTFISSDDLKKLGLNPKDLIKVSNPLNVETGYLKPDLLIPLLKNIALNQKNFEHFKLFEIGLGYRGYENEPHLLAIVEFAKNSSFEQLLADTKLSIIEVLKKYSNSEIIFEKNSQNSLDIKLGSKIIGGCKILSKNIQHAYGIEGNVVYANIELDSLLRSKGNLVFKPFSKYPSSSLDISLDVQLDLEIGQIFTVIKDVAGNLLQEITVLDAPYIHPLDNTPKFHQERLKNGQKNLVLRLKYGSFEHTLKDSEISEIHAKIIVELKSKFKAEIR